MARHIKGNPKFYLGKLFIDSVVNYHGHMNNLDHIVIAANNVAQGVAYVKSLLDVEVPRGGVHQTMGTHNHLMQLGNDAYLEIISINPDAQAPVRPRWFGLDSALMRDRIEQQPRLITWVINTTDIQQLVAATGFEIGVPTPLQRDNLKWEIALPEDGRLLADGMLPYCIQWHSQPHPSQGMADLGCNLQSLTIHHSRPQWVSRQLDRMEAGHLVHVEALAEDQSPYLTALIDTPGGRRQIG